MSQPARSRFGKLDVSVLDGEPDFGRAVARRAAEVLEKSVSERGSARVILATGNSQLPLMRALRDEHGIPWASVTVFHMDEYVGMSGDHPASFRRWIRENVEERFGPAAVHYIEGDAPDAEAEAARYEALLRAEPVDLVCMGIGENGHLAFNEPFQADFADAKWARVIELDDVSRQQQVGEGHFPDLDAVPRNAISLTVPALVAPASLVVSVPERRKAEAVRASLTGPISPACPGSILREQAHAALFLDRDSASLLDLGASDA